MTTISRVLSIALLLLTCAPLTSLYAVLFSSNFVPGAFFHVSTTAAPIGTITDRTNAAPAQTSTTSASSTSFLESVLRNPNATLEEFWTALFHDRGHTTDMGTTAIMMATLPTIQVHHWTIVLPWGISLILGVVVPCLLSLLNYLRPDDEYDGHPDENDPWISRFRKKEKRLKRLIYAIRSHQKVLEECDIDAGDLDGESVPCWNLPFPGEPTSPRATRSVEGVCAICLACYACGDKVVWSSNAKCPHVYHEDCLLSWLVRRRKQCPCCRRQFLIEENM